MKTQCPQCDSECDVIEEDGIKFYHCVVCGYNATYQKYEQAS